MSDQTPPHSWGMTSQQGERCEWRCSTHNPPCRETTYDGKGAWGGSRGNFEDGESQPTPSEKNFGLQKDFCFVCKKAISLWSATKDEAGNYMDPVWVHDVFPADEHEAVLGKWVRAE